MPTLYNGKPAALEALLPTAVNIASSTHATPIVVTTSTPHGLTTGDYFMVNGHADNTAANGTWESVVTSPTTVKLVGSVGNAVGGATGTLMSQAFGTRFAIPADGDPPNASTFNVANEAAGDRTALLNHLLGWKRTLFAGGVSLVKQFASETYELGSLLQQFGTTIFFGTSETYHGASSYEAYQNTAIVELLAGSIFRFFNDAHIKPGGKITVEGSGDIEFDASSNLICKVDSIVELRGVNAFTSTSTLADAGTTIRTGPTTLSGDTAYVGIREFFFDLTGLSTVTIHPYKYDVIQIVGQSTDTTIKLATPPGGAAVRFVLSRFAGSPSNDITIKDEDTDSTIYVFVDPGDFAAEAWGEFYYSPGASKWKLMRGAKD